MLESLHDGINYDNLWICEVETSMPFISSQFLMLIYRNLTVPIAKHQRWILYVANLVLSRSLHHKTFMILINLRLSVVMSLLKFGIIEVPPPFSIFCKNSNLIEILSISFVGLT